MRDYNSKICFLLLAVFVTLTSCGQKSTHEEDLKYYTSIGLQMKDVVPKVQNFWRQIKQGVLTAKQDETHKLDKAGVDSLKNYLSQIVNDLNDKIKVVSALKETDQDLAFKTAIIAYLTETKTLQEKAIPKILELLENGLDKINDEQKEALKTFQTKGQEMQVKSKEIEDLSLTYQKKHNITDEELVQYGL